MTAPGTHEGASRIIHRHFGEADESVMFEHGSATMVTLGREEVWRSELEPGWSWDDDIRPAAGGATSCPMTHREYVVSGRVRYLMEDGTEVEAAAGDTLFIPPGHRAWVVGAETCVLIDW
jgi:mannose-6-phosphate isomerase-like protein (cupin superfamily)